MVVTRSMVPLAQTVHRRGRSRELLKLPLGYGNICVQTRIFPVLLLGDSKFLPQLCLLDQFVTDPAANVILATGHQMVPSCLSVVGWAKAHYLYSLDFEELGVTLWAFIRAWEKDIFRRVAVAVSDCFSSDATHEVSVLASIVAAVEGSTRPMLLFLVGRTCGLTLTWTIWEAGTIASWLSTLYLICDFLSNACKRHFLPFSDSWIRFLRRKLLLHA